jgi:hypothetical protein
VALLGTSFEAPLEKADYREVSAHCTEVSVGYREASA